MSKAPDLTALMAQVVKKYPLTNIDVLGFRETSPQIPVISTGCLRLDWALGAGGVGRNRCTEVWGPDKGGKSSLLATMAAILSVMPQVDGREYGTSAIIDIEKKTDRGYFEQCFINSGGNWGTKDEPRCVFLQPDSGVGSLEIALAFVGKVDLVAYDSLTWFTPSKIEDENAGIEDSFWALQARIMGPYLQRLSSLLFKCGRDKSLPVPTAFVGVCQARGETDQYRAKYREGLRPGGPKSWKHIRSTQIFMRPFGYGLGKPVYGTNGETYGAMTKIVVEKNVIGKPRQYVEKPPVMLKFGTGIDLGDDALQMGLEMGLVEYRKPGYYWPGGERFAVGAQRAREYLNDNPGERDRLRAEISQRIQERAKSGAAFEAALRFMRWNADRDGEQAAYVKAGVELQVVKLGSYYTVLPDDIDEGKSG
jgi:recombination protein RecA